MAISFSSLSGGASSYTDLWNNVSLKHAVTSTGTVSIPSEVKRVYAVVIGGGGAGSTNAVPDFGGAYGGSASSGLSTSITGEIGGSRSLTTRVHAGAGNYQTSGYMASGLDGFYTAGGSSGGDRAGVTKSGGSTNYFSGHSSNNSSFRGGSGGAGRLGNGEEPRFWAYWGQNWLGGHGGIGGGGGGGGFQSQTGAQGGNGGAGAVLIYY